MAISQITFANIQLLQIQNLAGQAGAIIITFIWFTIMLLWLVFDPLIVKIGRMLAMLVN